ncbi:hypothetical protein COCON_G00207430 [Conger conger]|uniref:Myb/SANT-like DNA-binding domain-containing protein n=1 Tax=Conger conger TaxID=82655 RepID=A0A9Q1D038_CONCO|nr:hypothetical protein COCON_G00207430 [Conger conger]
MAGTLQYKWTDKETARLIRLRFENNHLFTGKKYTTKKAWEEILQKMGLQGHVSRIQATRKWETLKRKYKELLFSATGTGPVGGEATAATWPWFTAMHEAFGGEPIDLPVQMDSCAAEKPTHVADEALDASCSSPHGSVAAACSQACVVEVENEDDDTEPFFHPWTQLETSTLIRLRSESDHLFTGRKHTAKKAWELILQQMGLQAQVSPAQVSKKWDNMKRKYKILRSSATGTGTDSGEPTASTWRWFNAMHAAVGGGQYIYPPVLMDSCVAENPARVGDEALDVSGSSPDSLEATYSMVCVEVEGEEVGDDEDYEEAHPYSSSLRQEDCEPCTSACPPSPKRRRTCQGDILQFLKEEATKEEERFRAALESTNRFLDLFERLVNKL